MTTTDVELDPDAAQAAIEYCYQQAAVPAR
jgi:hypothetical protein